MKPKETFVIKKKYKSRFKRWGAEKSYAILMAMFEYEETHEVNLPEEYYDAFEPIREDLDAMRSKYEEVCERNRQNGQSGGRPKKTEAEITKPKETQKTHSVSEKPKKPDNDNDIDINNDIDRDNSKIESDSLFNKFWEAYPRKVSKRTAYKAFMKLKVDSEKLELMLNAIKQQKQSDQWQDERYIPHPTTWLNQERWNDVLPKATNKHSYLQRGPTTESSVPFGTDYLYRSSG